MTDAPAEEFLELDGGRVHLLRRASGGGFGPGYLVRLGCRATGPGLTGSSLASQDFWRRLRRCETLGRGHRGHGARIHAVSRLSQRPGAALVSGAGNGS